MKILFVQTGGTIDKDYPQVTKGWAFEFGEPATGRILAKLNPSFDYEVVTSCQKDSLDINKEDRENLVGLIKNSDYSKIIVTHGTDTLIETANYLAKELSDKSVVITGAMLPERFSTSDASINIGTAIAAVQLIEAGVFVAMHGIVKPVDEISRNQENGKFY